MAAKKTTKKTPPKNTNKAKKKEDSSPPSSASVSPASDSIPTPGPSSASNSASNSSASGAMPQLTIHTQYVKDLSFENPSAPEILTNNDGRPEIEVNVNVTANPQSESRFFEVVLTIRATAKKGDKDMFIAELAYAAVVSVSEEMDEKAIHPMVLIEGPRLIFPFARAIISDVTQSGGFMPLNIQPIDFMRVYQSGMQNQAQGGQAQGQGQEQGNA